jgi:hypothetical protein
MNTIQFKINVALMSGKTYVLRSDLQKLQHLWVTAATDFCTCSAALHKSTDTSTVYK